MTRKNKAYNLRRRPGEPPLSNFMTHNLSRLATFSGRETRAQFWPYAGVVFAVAMVAIFLVMAPAMASVMGEMQTYALAHPDQATISSGPGHYSVSIQGDAPEITAAFSQMASTTLIAVGVVAAVSVVLYGAAVARRLHDRGISGLWGLMPLPFLAFSLTAMPKLFAGFDAPTGPLIGLFFITFLSNLAYNVTLVILIVLLAKRSDPSANRYGPAPQV